MIDRSHHAGELAGIGGFAHTAVGPQSQDLLHFAARRFRREDHHRDRTQLGIVLHLFEKLEAVITRRVEVEKNEVGSRSRSKLRFAPEEAQRSLPVGRHADVFPYLAPAERLRGSVRIRRTRLDEQDLYRTQLFTPQVLTSSLRPRYRRMAGPVCTLALLSCLTPLAAATRLLVTVTDRSGQLVNGLTAGDFTVLDDKDPRSVQSAEAASEPVDIMLLLDTSLVGEAVQPLAANLISQLGPKEEMAIVGFASSADLLQDFTSSRQLLTEATRRLKYGNTPQVLDALYAAIDGGFANTPFRRVIVVLTTGLEGGSRVSDKDVIRLARKNSVSIFPVYLAGSGRWLFDELAERTGGAPFRPGDLRKMRGPQPGPAIFAALRQHYVLTIAGNSEPGEKLKVRVNRPDKLFVSAMPLE